MARYLVEGVHFPTAMPADPAARVAAVNLSDSPRWAHNRFATLADPAPRRPGGLTDLRADSRVLQPSGTASSAVTPRAGPDGHPAGDGRAARRAAASRRCDAGRSCRRQRHAGDARGAGPARRGAGRWRPRPAPGCSSATSGHRPASRSAGRWSAWPMRRRRSDGSSPTSTHGSGERGRDRYRDRAPAAPSGTSAASMRRPRVPTRRVADITNSRSLSRLPARRPWWPRRRRRVWR